MGAQRNFTRPWFKRLWILLSNRISVELANANCWSTRKFTTIYDPGSRLQVPGRVLISGRLCLEKLRRSELVEEN